MHEAADAIERQKQTDAFIDRLDECIDKCKKIEADNQDFDENGVTRSIDSIVQSRKLVSHTDDEIDKFHATYTSGHTRIQQAKSFLENEPNPDLNEKIADCEKTLKNLEENLEGRKAFLTENLNAWVHFEEMCDNINGE